MRPLSRIPSEALEPPSARRAVGEETLVARFERVGKRYQRRSIKPFLVRDMIPGASGPTQDGSFWAVQDVDLDIHAGEAVAVVGENGSGKTTLLSLVAGATHPTVGCVSVRGRLAPLLELGVGFQMDMTAPENAFINTSFLGLGRQDAAERLPEILAFADLGSSLHVPLRYHSRGMVARLGFAVAMHIDADLLIVDEVLAVGDGAFQEKCFRRVRELQARGTTLILVTHDLESARKVCTRAVWMRAGRVELDADIDTALEAYSAHLERSR